MGNKDQRTGLQEQEKAQSLEYRCSSPPGPGEVQEVASGVLWIRMPLPLALAHINVWAIRDGDGWAIVDTGMRTPQTAEAWCKLFDGPLNGLPVTRVFVTHMHPDHVGMAGWITRRYLCPLWMTRLEFLTCRVLAADTGKEAPTDGVRFYRAAGWTDAALENYRARFGDFGKWMYPLPDSYQRIHDGQHLRIGLHEWKVIVGSGHSPEHACLYCPDLKLLVSGDQVLPRISSNVSVHPMEPNADPVSDWLASLAYIRKHVPDDVLVLPAHDEPFHGLHTRLSELENSQHRGLDRLREALLVPKRVTDLFEVLFSRNVQSDPFLLSLATGEAIACLNQLIEAGEVAVRSDASGVNWYRLADRT
ncbi:Zn-dependent hydrolase [Aromatoleum bremense]|uniref:MBL fold metallo-hydrolase n=2 Tax=Aromatoleum bremense TaxID=76115 RepID=A0ABX1NYC3_9RHOO|nr:MBL fold metallo-hydrolase [Aromatoleum bremense]QTQ34164.1 Zn-dependent hydrolase [Aromatoleum bremense]